MAGNSDIRDSAVDDMVAVDMNGFVDHDESIWNSSFFSFEVFEVGNEIQREDVCEVDCGAEFSDEQVEKKTERNVLGVFGFVS